MEYFLKLYFAPDRTAHFLNRWHLLDLFIITLPVLEFLPAGYAIFRISPILRIFRVFRIFAVGGRTYKRRISASTETHEHLEKEVPEIVINGVIGEFKEKKTDITLDEMASYLKNQKIEVWFDISQVSKRM